MLVACGLVIAQGQPTTQGKAKAKAKAQIKAAPAQSPASRPIPQSATAQTYAADQIQAGSQRFVAQCGFCHGRDAAGGETGPDLTRSDVVA